jgi:hypothetical protein
VSISPVFTDKAKQLKTAPRDYAKNHLYAIEFQSFLREFLKAIDKRFIEFNFVTIPVKEKRLHLR